jgi:hypothetical protein
MLAPDTRHHRRFQADFPLIGLSELGQPPLTVPYQGKLLSASDLPTLKVDQRFRIIDPKSAEFPPGRMLPKDRLRRLGLGRLVIPTSVAL